MKKTLLSAFVLLSMVSCRSIYNVPSVSMKMDDLHLGMSKGEVVKKYGEPFSYNIRTNGNDTITVLSYKTPKVIATCGYIVTSKLQFVGNKLNEVSQEEFFVPDNVVVSDTVKVK